VQLDAARPVRRKLPDEREAVTHKFSIAGHEGYLTIGKYEDGDPGEIFLRMAKEGSTVSGLMDTIATMTSIALQYGVPLKALVDKFSHTRFEPSGFTNSREIPIAKSVMDYVFRFLGNRFLQGDPEEIAGEEAASEEAAVAAMGAPAATRAAVAGGAERRTAAVPSVIVNQADAPSCCDCGSIMIRNGACYKCPNCGATSGCS
jgi:ribonucleoside-diphosphate reductase alpha chain